MTGYSKRKKERRKYAEKVVVDRAKKDRLVARKERREAGPSERSFSRLTPAPFSGFRWS